MAVLGKVVLLLLGEMTFQAKLVRTLNTIGGDSINGQISDSIKDTPRMYSISSMNFVEYQDLELEHLTALASLGALLVGPEGIKDTSRLSEINGGFITCAMKCFSPINNITFISFDAGLTR